MAINLKLSPQLAAAAVVLASIGARGQSASPSNPADLAQRQVMAYVSRLADLHCNESVIQEKLAPNGHVETTERSSFDYLIMIDGDGDGFQFNESRVEAAADRHKNLPMLVTAGFSSLLLVFHPYYRDSFEITPAAEQIVDGKAVLPIAFAQIPGRRTPAALVLRGREYPLELQGTAWFDEQLGQIVKMDARLERDMSDIGLRSLSVHAEYQPTPLGKAGDAPMLPSRAIVDVETPRQHWRNTHIFDRYRAFSAEAEQDPNVKFHQESPENADKNKDVMPALDPQEKP